jgi:hypothetical protein
LATKRPSFLKREKERKRLTRANDKREARRAKKRARTEENSTAEATEMTVETDDLATEMNGADGANGSAEETPPSTH